MLEKNILYLPGAREEALVNGSMSVSDMQRKWAFMLYFRLKREADELGLEFH